MKIDRFGLGCFLFLIFACCRLSDVSYLDSLALDVPDKALRSDNPVYLEAQSMHHKTQRLKSKQGGLVLFKSRIFEEGEKCQQCAAAKPVRTLAGLNQQLDARTSA